MSRKYLLALHFTLIAPIVAEAQKDVASCKPVLDANAKQFATSYHSYISTTTAEPGSKPRLAETISTGGASYLLVQGQWQKGFMTPADMAQHTQENISSATAFSCKRLRDESVDGVAAVVYGSHIENEDVKADAQTWIAKATGLVLRTDTDVEGTSHISQRFEYTNVKAPANVQ